MTSETSSTAPAGTAPPYALGDTVFVYDGPGLVTRLEGWALSVVEIAFGEGHQAERRVAVFRDDSGRLDISSPLCVTPLDAAAAAWHLVAPDGRIVGGGPRCQGRRPPMDLRELEALRDADRYMSLAGSVGVLGLPDGVRHAPPAGGAGPLTVPLNGSFTAARGGCYIWFDPAL